MPWATHLVDHEIHPIACEAADALNEVLGAVVDRRGPKLGHEFVVVSGCRAVHLQSGQLAELYQRGAYASSGTVNVDLLAAADLPDLVQVLVCGEVVHDQTNGLGRVHPRGDGHRIACGQANELCVAATDASQRTAGNHLPRLQRRSISQFVDHPDDVLAQGERHARTPGEPPSPASVHKIEGRNPGGQNLHPDLAGPGFGKILFHDLQHIRATALRNDHPAVSQDRQ